MTPGLGLPWPQSLDALVDACGGNCCRVGRLLGIGRGSITKYHKHTTFVAKDETRQRFLDFGWTTWELPPDYLTDKGGIPPETPMGLAICRALEKVGVFCYQQATEPRNYRATCRRIRREEPLANALITIGKRKGHPDWIAAEMAHDALPRAGYLAQMACAMRAERGRDA